MATPHKQSIQIKEITSDSVVQHILPAKKLFKKGKRNKQLEFVDTPSRKSRLSDESDSDESLAAVSHTNVYDAEEPNTILGQQMYSFKTFKKSNQMSLKAEACSPLTLSRLQALKLNSPEGKGSSSKSPHCTRASTGSITPKKKWDTAAVREHQRVESSTPYRLRKRNMITEESVSSDDNSIDEETDEDEKENEESSPKSQKITSNLGTSAETYFDLHAMNSVTSDNVLSKLSTPQLDIDMVRKALDNTEVDHREEKNKLLEKHQKLFNKWMLAMCSGFNILLYGLGSKRSILKRFCQRHLQDLSHLVVNGYFPSLTIKHILNSITDDVLEQDKGFPNIFTQIDFIKEEFKKRDEDFYLVIHNIDGVLLRSSKAQTALSLLAECQSIHVIASVDHINSALLWNQNTYFRYRWLWFDVPTYLPYEAENSYENSLMIQQSGSIALGSLVAVMRSLTPNAKRIFILVIKYQLEHVKDVSYEGISFQTLYQMCREDFLVNSDLTLQAQLVEFKDHRLIKSKKNYEGIEHLTIPVNAATLQEFLNEYKDGNQ